MLVSEVTCFKSTMVEYLMEFEALYGVEPTEIRISPAIQDHLFKLKDVMCAFAQTDYSIPNNELFGIPIVVDESIEGPYVVYRNDSCDLVVIAEEC